MTIKKIAEIDRLMQDLALKYRVKTLQGEQDGLLWKEEALGIMEKAAFIQDEPYFYFLSRYGGCNISGDGFDVGICGFDDWLNPSLLTTPLLNDAGIYLMADHYRDDHDEVIFYGYHATRQDEKSIWVSEELECGYEPGYFNFTDFLEYILTIENGR
jgi:hypothetical protein